MLHNISISDVLLSLFAGTSSSFTGIYFLFVSLRKDKRHFFSKEEGGGSWLFNMFFYPIFYKYKRKCLKKGKNYEDKIFLHWALISIIFIIFGMFFVYSSLNMFIVYINAN